MKKKPISILLIFSFLCAIALSGTREAYSRSSKTIRVSEISMRRLATKSVMPEYPQESRKRGSKGVSVTEVETDEQGNVYEVRVIEAPDDLIKVAVADAVRQWKFKPSTIQGEPVRVQSKLTFYYVIDGQGARVENPKTSAQ